jgi:hypothetical protein
MNSASQGGPSPKKRYVKPNLKVYGDIEGLTASVGPASVTPDGGLSGTMTKTH